jgi:hypothetical protein
MRRWSDVVEWCGAAFDETVADRFASRRRFVAGAAATPGAMELRGALSPHRPGPGTNVDRTCDAVVGFASTSQPLMTIMDTGQRLRPSGGDAPRGRRGVEVVAGGRIVYHRLLDFVGADRATNKILYPEAIYLNHTSLLKR